MIKKQNNELWQILYPSLRIERYIFNLLSNRIILNGYVAPRENINLPALFHVNQIKEAIQFSSHVFVFR